MTLDDYGLKYEVGTRSYSSAWMDFDHRIERIGRNGNTLTVILMTKSSKWFALAAFGGMDEIVAAVRQYAPNADPQSLSEKIFFHPWFNPICLAFGFVGIWLIGKASPVFGLDQNQQTLVGWLLLVPTLVVTIHLLPRNPLCHAPVHWNRSWQPLETFPDRAGDLDCSCVRCRSCPLFQATHPVGK